MKYVKIFDTYIAMMLATVALATLLPARNRGAEVVGLAADVGIVVLFFLYGTRLSPRTAIGGLMKWKLHLAVLLTTFALFPALGVGLSYLARDLLPIPLMTGVVLQCLMPSTVQSSIAFTSIARGNVAAALCAASASNIIGVFFSPVLAGWLLHTNGVVLDFDVFRSIALQLLLPFVVGQVLRPWVGTFIANNRAWLGHVDRGSILLIIYVAFSKGMVDHVWSEVNIGDLLALLVILCALLLTVLVVTGFVGRRVMGLTVEDEIVLQFCGSKKSLASGLPMATVLFSGPTLSLIVLPLMVFHQLQLIVCAVLARQYAEKSVRGRLVSEEG